ncbi:type II toxin-antitoxin system RelE/ParE family toxin [candidate division KSB1 bacterium]|nr:type II toxin-antitoxin system RelE/ParE family toxin [candidate division KSB1 bacterium]
MKIKIHELAVQEFDEAIEWYELQSTGLGKRFKNAVVEQIKKVKKHPGWYLIEADNIYKAYVPKFPYKILYTIEDNKIIVVWAIAHLHRKPWYWQSRMH